MLQPFLVLAQAAQVVILGTGTPNPDPERSGPAVAVIVEDRAFVVDAGPGLVRRAALAASRHLLPSLRAARLQHVLLTHLHSDHTVGLPDVIHTGWVDERTEPLTVIGPPGTARLSEHLTEAWRDDIRVRTEGDQPHTRDGWRVRATDTRGGVVYQDSTVTITALVVPHTNWDVALAYRFETRTGQVVVVSGDTTPSDAIVDACNGCDILVHEAYIAARLRTRPAEWQAYHRGSHTSAEELAAIATRARPRLLVLYHQLYWGGTDLELLEELRAAGYQGEAVSARDLDYYRTRGGLRGG